MRRKPFRIAETLFLVVLVLFLGACAKKQVVKAEVVKPLRLVGVLQGPPAEPEGPLASGEEAKITSETIPPEAPMPIGTGSTPAGLALTQETPAEFKDIHFDFDESVIRPDAKPTLEGLETFLAENPGTGLTIQGNCDERGSAEYNLALGDRRAEAAKRYLVRLGLPAKEIATISFGKEKPLDPGHDESAWAKNRRDHFVIAK